MNSPSWTNSPLSMLLWAHLETTLEDPEVGLGSSLPTIQNDPLSFLSSPESFTDVINSNKVSQEPPTIRDTCILPMLFEEPRWLNFSQEVTLHQPEVLQSSAEHTAPRSPDLMDPGNTVQSPLKEKEPICSVSEIPSSQECQTPRSSWHLIYSQYMPDIRTLLTELGLIFQLPVSLQTDPAYSFALELLELANHIGVEQCILMLIISQKEIGGPVMSDSGRLYLMTLMEVMLHLLRSNYFLTKARSFAKSRVHMLNAPPTSLSSPQTTIPITGIPYLSLGIPV